MPFERRANGLARGSEELTDPTPMHKEFGLYTGTMQPKDLVAKVKVPRFAKGEPDVIQWGSRYFKRSGHTDENQEWKYLECFVYAVPSVIERPGNG